MERGSERGVVNETSAQFPARFGPVIHSSPGCVADLVWPGIGRGTQAGTPPAGRAVAAGAAVWLTETVHCVRHKKFNLKR